MSTDDEFAEDLAAHLDRLAAGEDAEPGGREAAVAAALRSPAVWSEPPDLRAAVLARALAAAPAAEPAPEPEPQPEPERPPATVTPLRPRWQRLAIAVPLAAAAAAVITIAVLGVQQVLEPKPDATYVALAAEGGARTEVDVTSKLSGFEIQIDPENLPAAPAGTYYAAWLRTAPGQGQAVPLGSFHNRRTGEPVILWSGVDPADYPAFSVTLQSEDQPPVPEVALKRVLQGTLRR